MGSKHTPGRLSPLAVARLKRADVEKKVYHADGGGLYLQMSPGGGKSWVFRYKLAGRTREMGLGSLHTLSWLRPGRKPWACARRCSPSARGTRRLIH